MKITNKYGLPQQFVDFAQQDYQYKENEYRATTLLRGVRETLLLRRYDHEIEVDVSDMVWLLFGTAVHDIMERSREKDTELKESRVYKQYGKYLLSGQFDLYCSEKKEISDYKTGSVWKFIFGQFEDWEKQLHIYAVLMEEAGFPVEKGRVNAFLKDHSKAKARREKNYPPLPVGVHKFPITREGIEETDRWIADKFQVIEKCEQLPDNELPLCTPEERWNREGGYAVMKSGRKSALRVLPTRAEAEEWVARNGKGEWIEKRVGEDIKCLDYCYAKKFCDHGRILNG